MSIASVIKRIPDAGRDYRDFIASPRAFVASWRVPATPRVPTKEVLAWCLAVGFLILGLYDLGFGPMSDDLRRAIGVQVVESADARDKKASAAPAIVGVWWKLGFGVGVEFPEALGKPMSEPQLAIFRMGVLDVVVSEVVPNSLAKKP